MDEEPTNAVLAHNLRLWADRIEKQIAGIRTPAFRFQMEDEVTDLRLAARRLEAMPDAGPPGEGE